VAREADRLAEQRAREFPEHYRDEQGNISPLPAEPLHEATVQRVRQRLNLLFGAAALLLLVACANLTHLFLARGTSRMREMSVRRALGAGTRSLAAQLAAESLLVAALGGLLGIALARLALRAFLLLNPGNLPRAGAVHIDLRVVLFAAATAIATALAFGLTPALRVAGASPGNVLRSGGRTLTSTRAAQRTRNVIVIAEVAFSLVLVAQAGWLVRSFVRLRQQPLGFRTENVLTIPLTPTSIRSPREWYARMEGVRQSLANVRSVERATFGLTMPLEWTGGGRCCWRGEAQYDGRAEPVVTTYHPVDAEYFASLEIDIIAGDAWSRHEEHADPHPAVITEPLAVQLFGTAGAAIGHTFRESEMTFRIAGVVADHRHYGPDQEHGPATFIPVSLIPFAPQRAHMAVVMTVETPSLHSLLRKAIWRAEPDLPVPLIRRMADWSGAATAQSRFESVLFFVFGAVALLLVAGGLAGTLFYLVGLHRRDMGIRLALGATGKALKHRIVLRGLSLAFAGSLIGGVAAWMSGRLLENQLFGVNARDFRTLGLAIAVLLTVAAVASWLPAKRAAATDPMESLRTE
jgi:putative ABC transport system permease protein